MLEGLGAYGGEDEPVDEKDYYRSNSRTSAAGAAMADQRNTHYYSGGGGAAETSGGAYGKEHGAKIEDLDSDGDDSDEVNYILRAITFHHSLIFPV